MRKAYLILAVDHSLVNKYLLNRSEKVLNCFSLNDGINKNYQTLEESVTSYLKDSINKNKDFIFKFVDISRKKRTNLYKFLKSLNYHVHLVLCLNPLEKVSANNNIAKESLIEAYKYMSPPRINIDCDTFEIYSETSFLKNKTNFNDFICYAKNNGILKTIERFISADYQSDLININKPHETPYHLESIEEHIDFCIKNSNDDLMLITAILHDLGKSICKNKGSYKGHDKLSSIYALRFFDEINNCSLKGLDVVEIINQHMNAHKGISEKIIYQNNLNIELLTYINQFKMIDEKSRITSKIY